MRKAEICAHIFSTNRLQHENSNHFLPAPPIGCHRAGPNRKPFPLIGRTGIWPHYPVSVDEVSSPLHAGWGKADLTYRFDRSRGTREILRKTPSGRQVERWQQHSLLYTLSKSSTSAVQWNTSMGLGYMHGIHRGRAITTSNLTLFGYSFSSSSYESVPFNAISALLETRCTLRITDYAGVGLSALVNANAHKTFVAA